MILTSSGFRIIEDPSDLPVIPDSIGELYLDVETTSFDDKVEAFHPYKGHRICGVAFGWIGGPIFYLPVRHRQGKNIDLDIFRSFFNRLFAVTKEWVNANVKFDAHFMHVDGIQFDCLLRDVIVYAKIQDSDRMGYGLKQLAREWLNVPMAEETALKTLLKSLKTKDYARVPIDILGPYACQDVAAAMLLYDYEKKKRDEEAETNPLIHSLWEKETKLTSVLFDMERDGVRINKSQTQHAGIDGLGRMLDITTRIHELTKIELSGSHTVFHDILITQLGLPVVLWNEDEDGVKTTPSFNKEAMKLYAKRPEVMFNERNKEVVSLLQEYRKNIQFQGLFVESFLEHMDHNNKIHPIYNQIVRTGRMSCSDPNIQQQNEESKELIIPEEGECFGCWDASQIEFRLIVDYCKIEEAIKAYLINPNMDYHQFVADMVRTTRKPAKTINFMLGYGAGKKKTVGNLQTNPEVMEEISKKVEAEIASGELDASLRTMRYMDLCVQRANEIYDTYHQKFPEISATARRAMLLCGQRGWIRNKYGRKRHLPRGHEFKAFNALVQGCAMDFIKDRMVALSPRYNEKIRNAGLRLVANIHDEIIFAGRKEKILEMEPYITKTLSEHDKDFRVPLIWEFGISEVSWADAKPGKKKENATAA